MSAYLKQLNSNAETVAQVRTKSNEVFRKHSGNLLWLDLQAGESIYLGNSIQTEKNSSSKVILNEGDEILIGPESLVRFERQDGQISLQLVDGKIEVNNSDKMLEKKLGLSSKKQNRLVVQTKKGKLEVKSSRVKIQADKNENSDLKVEVISGSAKLTDSSNTVKVLNETNSESKVEVIDLSENSKSKMPLQNLNNSQISQLAEPQRLPSAETIEAPVLTAPKVKNITIKGVE